MAFPHRPRFGEQPASAMGLRALGSAYDAWLRKGDALASLDRAICELVERTSPLIAARRLSAHDGGAQLLFKIEPPQTAGQQLRLVIAGQLLLAQALGKRRVVGATIGGRRGSAIAALAAHLGMKATIYVDAELTRRQPNALRTMRLHGAQLVTPEIGKLPNADLREAALDDWLHHAADSFLAMGLDSGPPPYPRMARDVLSITGRELQRQLAAEGTTPTVLVARGGTTADALGLFPPFLGQASPRLLCVEPEAAAPAAKDPAGRYALSSSQTRVADAILEGLEYPGVSREHRYLRASGRIEYVSGSVADGERTIGDVARLEGRILPLATAQAVAQARQVAAALPREAHVVVMIAERDDKFEDRDVLERLVKLQPD